MRVPSWRVARVLAVLAAAALAGCGSGRGEAVRDGRLTVVTTVAPVTSIVAHVVGDLAAVEGVVPEGTNSHTYEPPPSVAGLLARADVVFLNGLGLEEPTRRLAETNLREGATIVRLGERTITPAEYVHDESFPRERGAPNPHLWTNPPMALRYAEIVRDTMVERDPANAQGYRSNFDRFVAALRELDRAMRESFETLPRERRKLLTYHDAYAYFAKEYGWKVVGAIQVADLRDPTPKEVAALIEQVRRQEVPAIFGSEVFPSPVLEQIGRETGARYVDVLRDDDLPGEPGDPEHSWFGLMRFDYRTIVEALGGDARALARFTARDLAPDRARYRQ